MVNERFKQSLIEFHKSKNDYNKEKGIFASDVEYFMDRQGIPVRVHFFGQRFGVDIKRTISTYRTVPNKIPLNVLMKFCEEFGCEFEKTCCNGNRYFFTFGKLDMSYLE